MRFSWTVDEDKITLKRFLNNQGVSRRLLAKIKFQGGTLLVNKQVRNTKFEVTINEASLFKSNCNPSHKCCYSF